MFEFSFEMPNFASQAMYMTYQRRVQYTNVLKVLWLSAICPKLV